MPHKINRSAESGRFVSRADAKRSPGTTVTEAADSFITDAMEEAGVRVLRERMECSGFEEDIAVIRAVYAAMRRARA